MARTGGSLLLSPRERTMDYLRWRVTHMSTRYRIALFIGCAATPLAAIWSVCTGDWQSLVALPVVAVAFALFIWVPWLVLVAVHRLNKRRGAGDDALPWQRGAAVLASRGLGSVRGLDVHQIQDLCRAAARAQRRAVGRPEWLARHGHDVTAACLRVLTSDVDGQISRCVVTMRLSDGALWEMQVDAVADAIAGLEVLSRGELRALGLTDLEQAGRIRQ